MREPLFIKRNKAKWEEYDNEFTKDPDVLSDRFSNILDDLSYAQTFYPKGKTTQYLNERAVNFYNQIYKQKKEPISKILDFWRTDLPLMLYRNHKFLLLSFLLFMFTSFLGVISAIYVPDFFDYISPGYMDMTKDNIANGNPFGVYSDSNATDMFFHIAFNNISLSFVFDFIGGIFFGIASIVSTFHNGLMFGAFNYMFYDAGLGAEFGLVVMIHGIFELFALILSVAAGFRLCHSLIFIGTYSRVESVKKGFVEGMQQMVLVFILLFVAAILESYVTRLGANYVATNISGQFLPFWAIATILVLCSVAIIWYFVLLPIKVNNKFKNNIHQKVARNIGTVSYLK